MITEYYRNNSHKYMFYGDNLFSEFIFSTIKPLLQENGCDFNTAYEIGAGMGRFSSPILNNFKRTYLIEPAKDYYDLLLQIYNLNNVSIHNQTANIFFSNFKIVKGSTFFGFHVLHHFNNKERLEIYKQIVKSESLCVFVEPNPWNPLLLIQPFLERDMKFKEEIQYLKLTKNYLAKEMKLRNLRITRHLNLCFFPPFITNHFLHTNFNYWIRKFEKINYFFPSFGSYQLIIGKPNNLI